MPFQQQVGMLFNAMINGGNIRHATAPVAGALGATVTAGKAAYGAYAQLIAASVIVDPSWVIGMGIDTIADAGTLGFMIAIASGGAGTEVDLTQLPFSQQQVTAVGTYGIPAIETKHPVRVNGSPRLAARGATSDAAATHAINVRALLANAVGS